MCVAVEMVTGGLPWPKITTQHEAAVFKVMHHTISHGYFTDAMLLLKVGFYEDNQITELVQYDEYMEKYNYHPDHYEMYQELVYMWQWVFRKESSSRPAANQLLSLKWMREMELSNAI